MTATKSGHPELEPNDPFRQLVGVMSRLRAPDGGCPWDVEQTFSTIAPYTIEEAYEVADAIERNDMANLKEELGDLLFQSVFHAQMANEVGEFDIDDVLRAIVDKMISRHPHVFADSSISTAEDQTAAWEEMKAAERAQKTKSEPHAPPSALDGVALALPALLRAEKLTKRAARAGFDWPSYHSVLDKLDEEVSELREAVEETPDDQAHIEEELGDILFVCANLCRKLNVDPETALRAGNAKFTKRFHGMEALCLTKGVKFSDLDLEQQEALWVEVKALAQK